jgi:hypothetical protein
MPTIVQQVQVTTDVHGAYQKQENYNPPGWFNLTVRIHAKLLSPANTHAIGSYTVVAADGSVNNPSQAFDATTDQDVDLGDTNLSGGDNTITVAGRTEPPKPNTVLVFEISGTLEV